MTVAANTPKNQYTGNGVTTVFDYDFKIFDETELVVILTDALGVETIQTLNTHYEVSGVGGDAGGSVTFVTPPASGVRVTLSGDIPATQGLDLAPRSAFNAENLEAAFDKLTRLVQQLQEELGRCAKVPVSSLIGDLTIETPTANMFLAWDALAQKLVSVGLSTTALSVSAYIQTLLDDANAAAARVTLGENASGSFFTLKHKFDATTAPTTANDTSQGYAVGSWWFDLTGNNAYVCTDAGVGAAVWRSMSTDRGQVGFKNRVINGDFAVDQRNNGALLSVNANSVFYSADMWRGLGEATDGVFSLQRLQTGTPPPGFPSYLRAKVTTADASIGASQRYALATVFEGLHMADLQFGSAGAKTVTLSFWVRSTLTGSFSGALRNIGANRSYPFSYTINAANTWEFKSITIAGDITGTWPTDNTAWGSLHFDLGVGSSLRGAAGAWSGSSLFGVTGAVSLIGTLNAELDIGGVQLEVGSAATEFEALDTVARLARCCRYYVSYINGTNAVGMYGTLYGVVTGAVPWVFYLPLPVPMRIQPSVARAGTWAVSNCGQPIFTGLSMSSIQATVAVTGAGAFQTTSSNVGSGWTASAEL